MPKTREVIYGALLTALALLIPLAFGGYLGVFIPPFSATLASHVPLFLSMLVSPLAAFMVGAGSALGFLIKLGPIVGARAATHIIVGLAGALLIRRGTSLPAVLAATAPLHGLSEALVVLPFGFPLSFALWVIGFGTLLHHTADSLITLAVARLLPRRQLATHR
ncbi:MAG TPA: ECF transporter S component [Firmicutes bacterium]|jgi:niacin transporter|nr:ECF transporter S component [Bacillota bacterium]